MKNSTRKITIQFSAEAHAALKNFQARYPSRSLHEFTNAAVLYLAKQGWVMGLNADLEPLRPHANKDLARDIVAKATVAWCAEEDYDREDKEVRPRLVLV